MNPYIREFSEITALDVNQVGGKGANLGEMTRAGLPVPPGFCLTADAYREFIQTHAQAAIEQFLASTRLDDPEAVETASAALREFLVGQSMPGAIATAALDAYHRLAQTLRTDSLRVAVRSSATAEDLPDASFAGQQDTYLNIQGDAALLEHIKRCWASLWTARAIQYRHKQGFANAKVALAVVVQAMIESEVAGILFTANPINQSRTETVLNASWGLGEAIVSGLVTPDTWVVDKANGAILETEIATKDLAIEYSVTGVGTQEMVVPSAKANIPCLTDPQIHTLIALGDSIEQHYSRPMDIEWGLAREHFYLLQARPITTLSDSSALPLPSLSNLPTSNSTLPAATGEYNRSMFIEIFPDPLSPSFLSVITPLFASMLRFTFLELGFTPPQNIPAVGAFYNQPYFHREYIEAALAPLSPPVRQALVAQIINPFGSQPRKLLNETSPAFLGMVARLLRFMTGFPKQLPQLLADYRAEITKLNTLPLTALSDRAILQHIRSTLFEHASKLLNYDFLMIALIGITYQLLGTVLERYYGTQTEAVRARLISGVTGNVTMKTNQKIWDLAQEAKSSTTIRAVLQSPAVMAQSGGALRTTLAQKLDETPDGRVFGAELNAFLEQYGHREIRMDILYPTWGEDPTPVLHFLRSYFEIRPESNPHLQQARLVREREQLATQVSSQVQRDLLGRAAIAPVFQWVLRNTQVHTRERDTMHFELTRLFPSLRRALLELGARWQAQQILAKPDDIFFLTLEEMQAVAESPCPMQTIVDARRAEFIANSQFAAPPLLRNGVPVASTQPLIDERGDDWLARGEELHGIAGSPGRVSGIARIVRGPHEFDKLQRGEILVAPLTNPVWTPLFAIAGGLITQVGGILSHGAIVAREYGIPAVMAVPDATSRLSDGQRVTVDGSRGVVELDSSVS